MSLRRNTSWYSAAGFSARGGLFLRLAAISDSTGPVSVLDSLIGSLKDVCAGLPHRRKGRVRDDQYGSIRISVCEAWSVSPTIGLTNVSDGRS